MIKLHVCYQSLLTIHRMCSITVDVVELRTCDIISEYLKTYCDQLILNSIAFLYDAASL